MLEKRKIGARRVSICWQDAIADRKGRFFHPKHDPSRVNAASDHSPSPSDMSSAI
jgi:hypothetical protein